MHTHTGMGAFEKIQKFQLSLEDGTNYRYYKISGCMIPDKD
jgi:hypothetical protein